MYDAADRLALESEVSFTVLGKGEEFVLIDNSATDEAAHLIAIARSQGYGYTGVFGLKDGVPHLVCDPAPAAALTMAHAGLVFCRAVGDRLRHATKGDSVTWLRQMYALQDSRGCVNA